MLQRLRNNLAWALQWNRIPASPLCLEASRLSCMCISSHRPSSRLRVQDLVCDGAACDAISQQPSAHFIYPCKVHFTLLPLPLSSPCGVLPLQAAWVRGVGGLRGSDGWRKKRMRFVAEWGTDYGDTKRSVMCESTGTWSPRKFYIAGFPDIKGDWWLGSHNLVCKASIISGYWLWHALCLWVWVYAHTCVFILACTSLPSLYWIAVSSACSHQSTQHRLCLSSLPVSWGWTCVDSSHGKQRAQQYCSTYSKQPPTAHFFSFSCSFPARLYTYPHRQCLTELFFIHLA